MLKLIKKQRHWMKHKAQFSRLRLQLSLNIEFPIDNPSREGWWQVFINILGFTWGFCTWIEYN